jgi:hypothetical protein
MDSSALFSHPDLPQSVPSAELNKTPAEYPTFSDRPEKQRTSDTPSS